jgi:hypothetical protein
MGHLGHGTWDMDVDFVWRCGCGRRGGRGCSQAACFAFPVPLWRYDSKSSQPVQPCQRNAQAEAEGAPMIIMTAT